jgi:hypothetical protein
MPKTDPDKEKKQRKDFLKQASDMLEEMKRQLMKEMQGRVKEETEGVKDEGRDTYDLASDERDREINFILNDRERGSIRLSTRLAAPANPHFEHLRGERLQRVKSTG